MAEICQASINIPDTSITRDGILYAATYNPVKAAPKTIEMIYRSDILVIHHRIVLGISGMENSSMDFAMFRSSPRNRIYRRRLDMTNKNSTDRISEQIMEKM